MRLSDRLTQSICRLAYRCIVPWRRHRLRNHAVSIISNDCWSSFMYQFHHTPFNSPFIGLFIMPDDYLAILENPTVLHTEPTMDTATSSRFRDQLAHLPDYPLGILPGGMEIHFLHYSSPDEALEKWKRRVRRIDWDNCIVKFSQNNGCTTEHLRRFEALPYRTKVAFTCRWHPDLSSTCTVPGFSHDSQLGKYWKIADLVWNLQAHADAIIIH